MESLPTVKLGAVLKKHYTRRLLRNIWRAMRAERLNFLQGRIPFESYVYDGVINAATSERVGGSAALPSPRASSSDV